MQTGRLTMKDIFDGDKFFVIPNYQRAFAWERKKQLKDFWNDVYNQPKGKEYFLGSFLFHEAGKSGQMDRINIVDGQQRLTTVAIFLTVLIDKMKRGKPPKFTKRLIRRYVADDDIYKLHTIPEDNAFFQSYIIGDGKPIQFDTPSQKRLSTAKQYFTQNVSSLTKSRLEDLLETIETSVVLVHMVKDAIDASQIFELINDRGKRLTDLEALKSFLMYRISLTSSQPSSLLSLLKSSFSNIYRTFETIEDELREEQILTYHVIAFEKWKNHEHCYNPRELIKRKVNAISQKKDKVKVKKYIRTSSTQMMETFTVTQRLVMNSDNISVLDNLYMTGRMAKFYPILIKAYKLDNTTNKDRFSRIATLCEIIIFRSAVAKMRADAGDSIFYAFARDFTGDFDELAVNLTNVISDNWWRINDRFGENLEHEYFYAYVDRKTILYLLFAYENHLRNKTPKYPLLDKSVFLSQDRYTKLSIEHITARKAKNLRMTVKFEENYLHKLGNLVIDTASSNASKGNKSVKDKIRIYRLAPLMSHQEIEKEKINWKRRKDVEQYIMNRTERLKKFALRTWRP